MAGVGFLAEIAVVALLLTVASWILGIVIGAGMLASWGYTLKDVIRAKDYSHARDLILAPILGVGIAFIFAISKINVLNYQVHGNPVWKIVVLVFLAAVAPIVGPMALVQKEQFIRIFAYPLLFGASWVWLYLIVNWDTIHATATSGY